MLQYFWPHTVHCACTDKIYLCMCLVWFMVSNATSDNISVISLLSILLVEETGVPGENYRSVTSLCKDIP